MKQSSSIHSVNVYVYRVGSSTKNEGEFKEECESTNPMVMCVAVAAEAAENRRRSTMIVAHRRIYVTINVTIIQ